MARETAPDWTEAEDEWLRELYPLLPNAELELLKAEDGWPRDAEAIRRRANALGLRKDPSRGYRKPQPRSTWTDEMLDWARGYIPGHSEREVRAECLRLFGVELTRSAVKNAKTRLGVRSGTHGGRFEKGCVPANKGKTWAEFGTPEGHARSRATTFARGHVPANAGELLDERLVEGGNGQQWQVKVGCRDAKSPMGYWIPRARFEWERANGRPWPEGHRAVHADHDPLNDAPENVVPVPNELYPMVTGAVRGQLEWHDRETLEVAVLSARVTKARSDRLREARIAAVRPWKCDGVRADESDAEAKVD